MNYDKSTLLYAYRYEFQTEDFDVGFGIFRKTSKERLKAAEMETVLATQRSNSHLVPEDGAVECELPGICKLEQKQNLEWLCPFLAKVCCTKIVL